MSKFGPRLASAGGFINISQNAKKVVFAGSFTANCERKFLREVEHRTFSGREAFRRGQPVLYVTERCVFGLHAQGIELLEVAPGLDIERDILAHMAFRPVIEREPALMDVALFEEAAMGLRARLPMLPLADRFAFDAASRTFFNNFERLSVRTPDDVEAVRQQVESRLASLATASMASSTTTTSPSTRRTWTPGPRWWPSSSNAITWTWCVTPPAVSFAPSSARRWRRAAWRRTSTKPPTSRAGVCIAADGRRWRGCHSRRRLHLRARAQ